jgi:hypothetical protein
MKVLHIWNQAGTASLISNELNARGIYSAVLQDKKHDSLGISKYYNDVTYTKIPFLLHSLSASRLYDIIHLHDSYFMILPLKILYPGKKIIMHYHGSLVRNNTLGKKRLFLEKYVNKIIVSTPDLLKYNYQKPPELVYDMIDQELFKPKPRPLNGRAFSCLKWTQTDQSLRNKLITSGFSFHLETQNRNARLIPYVDFPNFLNQFEFYIDMPIINNKIVYANSCAGLQAMSLGLKVISNDGIIRSTLPNHHKPNQVMKQLTEIYKKMVKG